MDMPDPTNTIHEPAKTTRAEPHLYDFVDRAQTAMTEGCFPGAPGVLVVAKDTLTATRCSRRSSRPLGWTPGALVDGWTKRTADGAFLWVQRCGRYWSIGRIITSSTGSDVEQVLCCAFKGAPFCARTSVAAMRLAEHCHPVPETIAGCWTPIF
jgi:hypothetical protein